jgi:hypothetical protein
VRGEKKNHWLRVKLQARGRFIDPVLFEPELGDRAVVSPDGTQLELELALAGEPTADRDGVRFQLEGDGLTIESAMLDNAPLPAERVFLGRRPAASGGQFGTTAVDEASIREPFATLPSIVQGGGVSIRLQSVRQAPQAAAPLDEKTRDNLRALGYME